MGDAGLPYGGGLRVLVLGGTAEARELAAALDAEPGVAVTSSLAGRTRHPRLPVGEVRTGGFGGVEGLAAALGGVDLLIDATHPFAAVMTEHATRAASRTATPLVVLRRPGWTAGPGDDWRRVPSLGAAADVLCAMARRDGSASAPPPPIDLPPSGPPSPVPSLPDLPPEPSAPARSVAPDELRVLLATGRQGVAAFADVPGAWFLVRAIDPPGPPLPPRHELLLARGPFTLDDERTLLAERGIDVVVAKDSGGATEAKLVAARERGLPVVLVDRPPLPTGGTVVTTVDDAVAAVLARAG